MKLYDKEFFNFIIEFGDIINHPKYKLLKYEDHHGTNRYDHSLRVGINVYKFCRYYNIDYIDITKAALLHDFFFDNELRDANISSSLLEHPKYAIINSKKYFNVNKQICDMISTHMYPVTIEMPKTRGGLIVSSVDKMVSTKEFCKYRITPLGKLDLGYIDLDSIYKGRFKEKDIFRLLNNYDININYNNFIYNKYLIKR